MGTPQYGICEAEKLPGVSSASLIHWLIHSFIQHLVNAYGVPGTKSPRLCMTEPLPLGSLRSYRKQSTCLCILSPFSFFLFPLWILMQVSFATLMDSLCFYGDDSQICITCPVLSLEFTSLYLNVCFLVLNESHKSPSSHVQSSTLNFPIEIFSRHNKGTIFHTP
jgi:hypothetical protein